MTDIIFDICLSLLTAYAAFVVVEVLSASLAQRELDLMDERHDER